MFVVLSFISGLEALKSSINLLEVDLTKDFNFSGVFTAFPSE